MKEIKDFAACARKQHFLNTCFLKHSNKISQSRVSFRRKGPFIFLPSLTSRKSRNVVCVHALVRAK